MADIIDTLHPKNIPSDNLYPNIKTANIPDKGVTKEKLADGSIDESKLEGGSLERIVNEWLTAHPEATTTVQDNSITPVKLTDAAYGIISNDGFHFNLMSRVIKHTKERFIDNSGNLQTGASWKVTDYIDISGCNMLKERLANVAPNFNLFFTLYDSDKNLINFNYNDYFVSETDSVRSYLIPYKAKYIRINSFLDDAKNFTDGNFAYLYRSEKYAYKYGDSIEKPYDFTGKKLLAFGDSITWGFSSPDLAVIRDSYIRLFADKFGMTLNNKAVSGSTITNTEGSTTSVYYVITHTTDDTDFIIVAGGVNDYSTKRTVGSYGDTDPLTFYGAMHGICEHLKTYYPGKPVIFITPVNVTVDKYNVPMERLNLYRNAIYEVATSYGYDVVNGIDMIPVDGQGGWNNTMIADSDGIHPTASGHALFFRNLCNKLL